jgi:methionyl-tRNA formyltransferase
MKIFFLLNHLSEFNAQTFCKKYLKNHEISYGVTLPENPESFDLITPWNYKKIIKDYKLKNIIIFHSSDLPKGKGWAPIFNVFYKELDEYVISAILLDEEVDSGNIIAQGKFQMRNTYTAEFIRKIDEEVSIMMISDILERMKKNVLTGAEQDKTQETYYARRYPKDNELNVNSTLASLVPSIKGSEKSHPSFFYYKGDKFIISIKPSIPPSMPDDLKITLL